MAPDPSTATNNPADQEECRRNWEMCWTTVEGLARDAARWHDNCGNACGIDTLAQWRERVLTQLKATLAEEQTAFEQLSLSRSGYLKSLELS